MRQIKDISGERFSNLVALGYCGRNKYGQALWSCQCDCGRRIVVQGGNLRTGNSRSCGCSRNEGLKNKQEKHPMWKGNKVSYKGLHIWVNNHKKKYGYCSICKSKTCTEFANISRKYKRNLNDFIELCKPCHAIWDEKVGSK